MRCYKNAWFLKKNGLHLFFSREEEFSTLPSKNKVADEKAAAQRQQSCKKHPFLEHPKKRFSLLVFSFRALK